METTQYINWLKTNIHYHQNSIVDHQFQLDYYIKKLQEACKHPNIVELPRITYSGIAAGYARRFCKECRLEESEATGFQKLLEAHKILNDPNNAVRMSEYMEIKEKS